VIAGISFHPVPVYFGAPAQNGLIDDRNAEKGVRKENYVLPHLRRMVRNNAYGVSIGSVNATGLERE